MIASIEENGTCFKPCVLKLEIKNIEELFYLWHMFNASNLDIAEVSNLEEIPLGDIPNKYYIWEKINNEVKKYKYNKI